MASRLNDYRVPIDNDSDESSNSVIGSDDDQEEKVDSSFVKFPTGVRHKKKFIISSSSESDLEDEDSHKHLHSTHLPGCEAGLPELSEEEIFADTDTREKEISRISEKHQTSSETAISDHDIIFSDEDQEKPCVKPRKSARISFALSKLLSCETEAVKAVDVCENKIDITLKNNSDVFASEDEQENSKPMSSHSQQKNDISCSSGAIYVKQKNNDLISQIITSDFSDDDDNGGGDDDDDHVQNAERRVYSQPGKREEQIENLKSVKGVAEVREDLVVLCSSDKGDNNTDVIECLTPQKENQNKVLERIATVQQVPDSGVIDLVEEDSDIECISCEDISNERNEPDQKKINGTYETGKLINSGISETKLNDKALTHSADQLNSLESKFNKMKPSDVTSDGMQKPYIKQSRPQLQYEIDLLTKDITKLKNTFKCVDISKLPDKGIKLQMKYQESLHQLKIKERELAQMPGTSMNDDRNIKETIIQSGVHRLPPGFGVRALQTQIKEKTLTEEALSDLHGSISTCPAENAMADQPLALKSSVELMPHQRHALLWLSWRETQKPPAGILADDMGLGKTLTMISLVLKAKEEKSDDKVEDECEEEMDGYPLGGTLVVCPASLLHQWEDEIKRHCKRGVLEVEIHHGTGREENARRLSENDIVITTYSIVRTSANKGGKDECIKRSKRGVLHRVRWTRIILDEAHVVRNHKSQQSIGVCLLMGRKRWALTGTPIHNKELDLYALLKFLRCSPFDDYNVWRRWVDNKNTAGIKRLNTLINAIMLRRTKEVLLSKNELGSLPEKGVSEILVQLNKGEFDVYTKILWFSKTLFAQFLQQKAEKEMGGWPTPVFSKSNTQKTEGEIKFTNNPELNRMFSKFQEMRDIKTHEILVLLLRLRQICVHPGLIKAMLDKEAKEIGGVEDGDSNDILSKMESMSLKESPDMHVQEEEDDDDEEETNVLRANNPVFDLTRVSSKMKAIFEVLQDKVLNSSDKAIIVSQWTSMLNIFHDHLRNVGVRCDILSGAVPVKDRMDIVNRFNREGGGFQVLLLSLTAGGVGLNLTGANYLFMVDLHWNPQLECQAFDRIYRVGQKKHVFIYKFICRETIEERIKLLQDKKLSVASNVLSGTMRKDANKLTLNDLKSLFSM